MSEQKRGWRAWRAALLTLGVSLMGGGGAMLLHLPAAFLLGGSLAVSLFALAGGQARVPLALRNIAFVTIGMTLGTNVAPDTLELIAHWPLTLAGLALLLAIVVSASGTLLHKCFGLDRTSAFLSAFPGHLSFVMAIAESGHGDTRRIVIIQTIRLLMLTISVPLAASFVAVMPMEDPANAPATLTPLALALLIVCCTGGGLLFQRFKIPAGFVLGSMLAATAGKLMGLYEGALPWIFPAFSFVIMGCLIGARFTGVRFSEFRRAAAGGMLVTLIALLATSAIAYGLSLLVALPFGQIWIGLAPGGVEAMGVLGIALGYDTAFIAAHHTARLFMLALSMPLILRLIDRRPASRFLDHSPPGR